MPFDTTVAHQARVYDYWLGGKDNYAADREAAEQAIRDFPGIVTGVKEQRAFLARAVRYLTGPVGIRQFLDIGTGLPSANNTHEVAQAIAPESRVVYVDNDPLVLTYARALLASGSQGTTAYLDADLRDTDSILEQAADTLDFTQPIGILLIGVLQLIADADAPEAIVGRLLDAVPSGSRLAIAHPASDVVPELVTMARHLNQRSATPTTLRSRAGISRSSTGWNCCRRGWCNCTAGSRGPPRRTPASRCPPTADSPANPERGSTGVMRPWIARGRSRGFLVRRLSVLGSRANGLEG